VAFVFILLFYREAMERGHRFTANIKSWFGTLPILLPNISKKFLSEEMDGKIMELRWSHYVPPAGLKLLILSTSAGITGMYHQVHHSPTKDLV
jgi:hypothetical protein